MKILYNKSKGLCKILPKSQNTIKEIKFSTLYAAPFEGSCIFATTNLNFKLATSARAE